MGVRSMFLGTLAAAAAFGLSPLPAHAGTFSISPIRVDLAAAAKTGVVTVRNEEPSEVVVQATVVLWEQQDGIDKLTPTQDLLVSPAVFTLPTKGSQLVRVALRRDADPKRELSYRLLLQEVPQTAKPDFTGLTVALQISLPVWVAARGAGAQADVHWSAAPTPDGLLAVTARNDGNAHFRIVSFKAEPFDGSDKPVEQSVATYLLPGQSKAWVLGNNKNVTSSAAWRRIRIRGTSESGEFEAEATPGPH
jgi:fimbrial chaperone protein